MSWQDSNWRDWLPVVFRWLDSVSISQSSSLLKGACHVVPFEWNKDHKSITWNHFGLTSSLSQNLAQQTKKFGFKDKPQSVFVEAEDCLFLLIPLTSLKVTPTQKARQCGLEVAKILSTRDFNQVVLCPPNDLSVMEFFYGISQGFYRQEFFKSKDKDDTTPQFPERLTFLCKDWDKNEFTTTKILAKGAIFARTIQDAPANVLTPPVVAQIASDLAEEFKIKCTVKGRKELKALGMGAFHSVAQGSVLDPKLIVLEIAGHKTDETTAFVGKGLTFDSGGYCLKPGLGMPEMKYDMCGAAVVLATAYVTAQIKPRTNVVCAVGAVENMLGPEATRPGDIVKAMNGKTIEIGNTDAEGRLVLADVLHYVITNHKPKTVVDIATLTGAVQVALGSLGCAVLSNDENLSERIVAVAKAGGEPIWPLPIWPELLKELKSETADLHNIASPSVKAGTCVAGAFLKEFVGTTSWAHLDIAGTGWNCKATGYPTSGGSAFGLHILTGLVLKD